MAQARSIIYARVSRDLREGQSVSQQVDAWHRRQAEEDGWVEVREPIRDNDRGASRFSMKTRPGYAELLAVVQSGTVDVVCVWDCDRLTRDLETWLPFRTACRIHGVKVCEIDGSPFDVDDPVLTVKLALSEGETFKSQKRIVRDSLANAQSGRPHGKILYGYTRIYDSHAGGRLKEQVPHEAHAAVVLEVYRRFARGESRRQIMTDLNKRRVAAPRGSTWNDVGQLTRILRNPGYVGQRVHRGQVIREGTWRGIVPPALWARVQTRLDGIPKNERPGGYVHLLSGIAKCGAPNSNGGICGLPLATNKASRAQHSVLKCGGPTLHLARREDEVNRVVESAVVRLLSRAEVVERFADVERADGKLKEALDHVAVLEARLTAATRQYAHGELNEHTMSKIEHLLVPMIDAARRETHRWRGLPQIVSEIAGADALARWKKLGVQQQRGVISALVTVTVYPVGRGTRNQVRKVAAIKVEPRHRPASHRAA